MCHNILLPSKGSNEWRNIPLCCEHIFKYSFVSLLNTKQEMENFESEIVFQRLNFNYQLKVLFLLNFKRLT